MDAIEDDVKGMARDRNVRPYMRLTIRVVEADGGDRKSRSRPRSYLASYRTTSQRRVKGRKGRDKNPPYSSRRSYVVADVGPGELLALIRSPAVASIEVLAWGRYATVRAKGGEEHLLILSAIKESGGKVKR